MAKIIKAIDWYIHATMIVSIILIVISFFLPPQGDVSKTAMEAVGELGIMATIFTFLARLPEYIKAGATARITKGNTTLEITSDNTNKTTDDGDDDLNE